MGYGPYRYVNGQKLTYGGDGRWWLVTKSYGGNDYGYPTSGLSHHHQHHHHGSLAQWQSKHHSYGSGAIHPHAAVPKGSSAGTSPKQAEDPDDLRIRQLAIGINAEAGWIGTGKGIGLFYGASLLGAGLMVGGAAAGGVLNEALMGSSEGRLFYESWNVTQPMLRELVESGAGRIISSSPLGAWIESTIGYDGVLSKISWSVASRLWASGAAGAITIVMTDDPNDLSYFFLYEAPRLFENPNVFMPFRYLIVPR